MTTVVRLTDPPLAARSGRGVTVATIDSGIASGHPHVGFASDGVTITDDGSYLSDFEDRIGHGTAVAAVIRDKAPNVGLLAVRVFHHSLTTTADSLVRGIDWATQHGAHLINLSLGTPNQAHEKDLAHAVSRATQRGVLIVSAAEHRGTAWLPGSLTGVVPVVLDRSCDRADIHVLQIEDRQLLGASGLPRPVPGVPIEHNLQGISFAVANVTGALARLLETFDRPRNTAEVIGYLTDT